MTLRIDRRKVLALGAVGAALATIPAAAQTPAAAPVDNGAQAEIMKFTGGRTPVERSVTLDLPEIAENGNAVNLTVSVQSPMTAENHVRKVLVVADGNPLPRLATFTFSPVSGRADAETRVRLGQTQNVIAVAALSDGSFVMASRQVKVTIGGCGG